MTCKFRVALFCHLYLFTITDAAYGIIVPGMVWHTTRTNTFHLSEKIRNKE